MQAVIIEGAAHLADGGLLQVLGNWAHVRGQDWADRLREWISATGCDAHVVQREVMEPAEYIELWLADAGLAGSPDYRDRYAAWLDYFDRLRIEAVGHGLAGRSTRPGAVSPSVRIEHWPYPIEQPIGPALAASLTAVDREARLTDNDLLATRWTIADDVIEESQGLPGAADPQHLVFRQQRGFRRAIELDTAMAGILGACDGRADARADWSIPSRSCWRSTSMRCCRRFWRRPAHSFSTAIFGDRGSGIDIGSCRFLAEGGLWP